MEKTLSRQSVFTFSNIVYQRESFLILRKDSSISNITSLIRKLVCGDKNSAVEAYFLRLDKINLLVIYMEKNKCLAALRDRSVSVAIMPLKVSSFLGQQLGFKTKEILDKEFFSDVGFAFKKMSLLS